MNLDKVIAVRNKKIVYRDGNYAIKLFDDSYSKIDVLNEALNQSRIENIGLNVPKIFQVTMIDGKWAIVSEFIEGKTLLELMIENPDKLEEYLELFVDIQMNIHSKRVPMLSKLKDKMREKISNAEIDDIVKYDLHTRLESMPKHNKLCHGDFDPSNVIIKENGEIYILDWAHVTQGNASADIARTYLVFCLKGKKAIGKKYIDIFCKKSGTKKKYVQSWMPIVAASQSVKGNLEEREFLLSWVNVVDY